ncbi:MAG: phage tail sheath subtilisin-like domain-containing protein, partial [Candidatus Eremiobacteraeota bacterium]|nr:phage tail sheath subtilisin-like domain-containing protein [Candidatus Eremiobacteraeota bacterium]
MNGRAPGVYIEPSDPQARPVAPARSDVAAFVGIAQRGPIATPVRVTSYKEFARVFGSFIEPGYLAYAVRAFFENRGIAAWIVRSAAPPIGTTVANVTGTRLALLPALWLRNGTVVALSQGQPKNTTATVLRHVVDADPAGAWIDVDAPLAGVDARESPPIDVTKKVTLSSGATIASTTLLARDGTSVAARLSTSSPGSWGNTVAVRILRESVAQTEVVSALQNAQSAIPVASIGRFARGDFIRVRQGSLPPTYRVVCDVDAATGSLIIASNDPGRPVSPSLNVPLPATFAYSTVLPMTIDLLAIHVLVLENDQIVEDYPRCSPLFPDTWSAQFINANSRLSLDASSLPPASLDPQLWPADVDAQLLAGATDGVRMLRAPDVLAALASVAPLREPTLVAIPDACAGGDVAPPPEYVPTPQPQCTDTEFLVTPYGPPPPAASVAALPPQPQEAGPSFSVEQSAAIAQGLVDFCEIGAIPGSDYPPHPSFRFALVDVPRASEPMDFRRLFDASRAAIHWPWAGVYDPLAPNGGVRFVPPSGHVAGSFAAMDVALGPHHSAANSELQWVVALDQNIGSEAQAIYNDDQINVIRALPNRGIRIYGARTLSSDGSWLYIPVRRLMSLIENAILSAMQWAVFEPNNATLRALVRRSCLTLLDT